MTKIILRDEVAALKAERDLLRARLAKARARHRKVTGLEVSGKPENGELK